MISDPRQGQSQTNTSMNDSAFLGVGLANAQISTRRNRKSACHIHPSVSQSTVCVNKAQSEKNVMMKFGTPLTRHDRARRSFSSFFRPSPPFHRNTPSGDKVNSHFLSYFNPRGRCAGASQFRPSGVQFVHA